MAPDRQHGRVGIGGLHNTTLRELFYGVVRCALAVHDDAEPTCDRPQNQPVDSGLSDVTYHIQSIIHLTL